MSGNDGGQGAVRQRRAFKTFRFDPAMLSQLRQFSRIFGVTQTRLVEDACKREFERLAERSVGDLLEPVGIN